MFNRYFEGTISGFEPIVDWTLLGVESFELFSLDVAGLGNIGFYIPIERFENVELSQEVRVEIGLIDRISSINFNGIKYLRARNIKPIKY